MKRDQIRTVRRKRSGFHGAESRRGDLIGRKPSGRLEEGQAKYRGIRANGNWCTRSASENEGDGWQVEAGSAYRRKGKPTPFSGATEQLQYNNPFNLEMERVWFDGKLVYAVDCGEIEADPGTLKVAQEYQPVFSVTLDKGLKPKGEPKTVPGQYNIYDSVPGMEQYSPLWQFNYVIVPKGYEANTLRSEKDCLDSGYRILKSNVVEN